MGVELMEDIEKADIEGVSGRLRKERTMSLVFAQGQGVFTEESGLVYVSPQASRNCLEQR